METVREEGEMNREDIIRMAREAGGDDWGIFRDFMPEIERFANLVAAAVTKKAIEACRVYLNEEEPYPGFQNGVECCIAAIENREEFLKHMRGRDEVS